MENLFNKKLLLVTGKGGVGKSTVSLALAQAAAASGLKTALILLSAQEMVESLYGLAAEIGYKEKALSRRRGGGLYCLLIDPKSCLHEYVLKQVKFELLYHYVFENRVMQYFLKATPGLDDLLLLGKIVDMAKAGKRKSYDLVIVDMPATGHGINMLRVPHTARTMIQSGPLSRYAVLMDEFISDPEKTAVCPVTLPEEMPVNETLELVEVYHSDLKLPLGTVFINGCYPEVFKSAEKEIIESLPATDSLANSLANSARSQMYRHDKQSEQIERVEKRAGDWGLETIHFPFVFDAPFTLDSLNTLTSQLTDA